MNGIGTHTGAQIDEYLRSMQAHRVLEGKKVLDTGTGNGHACTRLMLLGADVVDAHDIKKSEDWEGPSSTMFYLGVPPPVDSYDIVFCHHVVEHVLNLGSYLMSLHSSLKDDGELWLACPNTLEDQPFALGHMYNFNLGNIMQVLRLCLFNTENACWQVVRGQLRVRVQKCCWHMSTLPVEFQEAYKRNIHFDVHELPAEKGWEV